MGANSQKEFMAPYYRDKFDDALLKAYDELFKKRRMPRKLKKEISKIPKPAQYYYLYFRNLQRTGKINNFFVNGDGGYTVVTKIKRIKFSDIPAGGFNFGNLNSE